MLTASTPDLDLIEVPRRATRAGAVAPFPINCFTGASTPPSSTSRSSPATTCRTHTDSAEEILYIVAGEGEAGRRRAQPLRAGDLAVIPAMVPHGVVNTGDEPLKVVGFFSERDRLDVRGAAPADRTGDAEQGAPAPAPA